MKNIMCGIAFVAVVFAANLAGAVVILVAMTALEHTALSAYPSLMALIAGIIGVFASLVCIACFTAPPRQSPGRALAASRPVHTTTSDRIPSKS